MFFCPCCNGHFPALAYRVEVILPVFNIRRDSTVVICPHCAAWSEINVDTADLAEFPGMKTLHLYGAFNVRHRPLTLRSQRGVSKLYQGRES